MTNVQQKTGITNEQRAEVKQLVSAYCEAKGISRKKLATQIGVSDSLLTQIDRENWESISDEMWRRVWNKVSDAGMLALIETGDFRAVFAGCEQARKNRMMVGITGDTGMGKTTALKTYAQRKNVFYVAYDKTMKPKQFFIALLREMGIQFEGSIHDMVNRIADELNTIVTPLVVIDEAGKITHSMILYLHVLRDKTNKNCGFVLGGMPYFKENLIKQSNRQKEGYAEFLRRVNVWHALTGLSRSEIRTICNANGIADDETQRDMYQWKRFGDLCNAIKLFKIENN